MMSVRLREDVVRAMAISHGAAANIVEFAPDARTAQAIASGLGRPVAIKLVADDVMHKSRAGGVLLGIAPDQVAARTDALLEEQRGRGAIVRGVTVEAMVDAGLEAVVGGLRTPGFGAVVMFGAGGVDIEMIDDVAFALAPLGRLEAENLVRSTRLGRVVAARMGERVADLVDMILAIGGSSGMLMSEQVTEIDLNPVVVTPARIVAVDARATALHEPAAPPLIPNPRTSYEALRPAIYPKSIAVLGASADPAKMGHRVVRNLVEFGFPGTLLPVSRTSAEICGVPTVRSIDNLPMHVDRAVIALPAAAVPGAVVALAARGARTAHVYTAETPPFDPAWSDSLRVIGPNCIGHYTPYESITMIASHASSPAVGGIAVVSQSGTYAGDAVRRGNELGLRFSFVTSVGNCEDVTPAELLAFCEADDRTEAAAFYLEDDRGADAFFRFAKLMTKPIVLLKGGRSVVGGAAAASHTGALASDPQLLADAARQAGVLLVDDLDQMLDVLSLLQSARAVDGDGLGLIGSGGGVAVVGADKADAWELTIPRLGETARGALERFVAPGASLVNPIDVPIWSLFSGAESFTGAIIEATAADAGVDVLCAFLDLGTVFDMYEGAAGDAIVQMLTDDLLSAPRQNKPLALVLRSGLDQHQDDLVRRLRIEADVSIFDSVDRAIAAIGAVRWLTRWRQGHGAPSDDRGERRRTSEH